jgi:DNA invertase Pin-like site-specific DNA recombinase
MSDFIAYYRVSTAKQGASGLGLEAQQSSVMAFIGHGRIHSTFTEVESGKRDDRPELDKALAAARIHRIPVVVAKVDRLTRSVAFLSKLLEAGVDIRFADLPSIEGPTGRFMLQQMAAVAELEAGYISARTKAALAAAKARGVKLGGNRGVKITREIRLAGAAAARAKAKARAADIKPVIDKIITSPDFLAKPSFTRVANELNQLGIPTAQGKGPWKGTQVQRVMELVA